MKILLNNIGKQYNYHWILRRFSYEFSRPGHYGILGNNGSGKSTLVKILSGYLPPSEGEISWKEESKDVSPQIFRFTGIASPHLELIEEFSLAELLNFHKRFKPFVDDQTTSDLIQFAALGKSAGKPIKYFSSGMKQRVKLLLALCTENPLVLLDEPCSNLDHHSIKWYEQLLDKYGKDKLLIIASNAKETECFSCTSFIDL